MTARGLERDRLHEAAWGASYPHPLVSCLMPLTAMLALTALMLCGFELWQWSLPHTTTVPAISHLKSAEAIRELQHAGLRPRAISPPQPNEDVPAGCVVSTNPAEGRRVKAGRQVLLLVSSGSAYTAVPEIRELPEMLARNRLTKVDLLVLREQYAYHPTIPFDRVIDIAPTPGTRLKRFSTVNLTVSKGPQPTEEVSADEVRSTVVTIKLPTDVEQPQELRIDLTDDDGLHTVYQETREPGETVTHTVQGMGVMTVEVYYGKRRLLTRKL